MMYYQNTVLTLVKILNRIFRMVLFNTSVAHGNLGVGEKIIL
jgi:hypothetical protein